MSAAATLSPARPVHRLEAQGLAKSYGQRKVVKGVSLAVDSGEVVGLLGPNGAGKTTSFYMIVGLVRADEGQITAFALAGIQISEGLFENQHFATNFDQGWPTATDQTQRNAAQRP